MDNRIDFLGFRPLSLSEFFIYCISSSWVSSLKRIRAGSKDVEGCIRPVGRRLPICGLESRQFGMLIIPHTYRLPRPVTGIALASLSFIELLEDNVFPYF
jgi:hypothetical protein